MPLEDRLLAGVLTICLTLLVLVLGGLIVFVAVTLVDAVGVLATLLVFTIFAVLAVVIGAAVTEMIEEW